MTTPTKARSAAGLAQDAIEGVPELRAALARIKTVTTEHVNVDRERRALIADAAATMAAGKPYPTDLADRFAELQAKATAAREAGRLRDEVEKRLTAMLRETIEDGTDTALDVLRNAQHEVLAEAADLDRDLGPVQTADDAIKAGPDAVQAWAQLDALLERYLSIRREHATLLRPHLDDGEYGLLLREHGEIRDRDQLWVDRQPPWPHNELRPEEGPTRDRRGFRWLAAHRDRVWLPGADELRAAREEAVDRRSTAIYEAPTEYVANETKIGA
ncbi:hypothetical protein ACQPX6_21380 [Actinomycetospora sp. CA-101289]|uniref:hypothetical protein n=1 Tax=Actinomycetospora sp. CA-101289 TaxID=3239893 RepID=UPI003D999801